MGFGKGFMWIAKLFGVRRDESADDEPARFPSAPVTHRQAPKAAPRAPAKTKLNPSADKGFDPYNSGAFKRENAWERIPRR
jgi:hypothetical protein